MKDEEFKQRLSEVAEWEIPKLSITDIKEAKQRARGRRSAEEKYQEEHEQVFAELFDGVNPTTAPMLLKVKHTAVCCDDCGKLCQEGRKTERKLYDTNNKKNWRERCVTCNKNKNPYTGKFDLTPSEAPFVWSNYLRDRKGVYQAKHQKMLDPENVVITINPENPHKI